MAPPRAGSYHRPHRRLPRPPSPGGPLSTGVRIEFDGPEPVYRTGGVVSGHVVVDAALTASCGGVILRHQWRTDGRGTDVKGRSATALLHEGPLPGGRDARVPFRIMAPDGPFTYRGHHLNVAHYLQAVVDLPWGRDATAEERFVLVPGEPVTVPPEMLDLDAPARQEARRRPVLLAIGSGLLFFGLLTLPFPGFMFLGLALILFLTSFARDAAERRTGAVEVVVEPRIVSPGQAVEVVVGLSPPAPTRLSGVTATLRAREECVSGSGNSSKTHRHVGHEETVELMGPADLEGGREYIFDARLPVPAIGMWSFKAHRNKVVWEVEVVVDVPSWPDWTRRWEILVWPSTERAVEEGDSAERLPAGPEDPEPGSWRERFTGERNEGEGAAPALDEAAEEPWVEEAEEPWIEEAEWTPVAEVEVEATPVPPSPRRSDAPADRGSHRDVPGDGTRAGDAPAGGGAAAGAFDEESELVAAVRQVTEAGVVSGERKRRIDALVGRTVDRLEVEVHRVHRPYGRQADEAYRDGRILRGRIPGTRFEVEAHLPAEAVDGVRHLKRGDRYLLSGEVTSWETLPDRPVVRVPETAT